VFGGCLAGGQKLPGCSVGGRFIKVTVCAQDAVYTPCNHQQFMNWRDGETREKNKWINVKLEFAFFIVFPTQRFLPCSARLFMPTLSRLPSRLSSFLPCLPFLPHPVPYPIPAKAISFIGNAVHGGGGGD
jgi:hypothetical protein